MVLVLVGATGPAIANSLLDPYANIQAPQPVKKNAPVIPTVDNVTAPATYVTMPMGDLSADKPKNPGIIGTVMAPFSGVGDLTGGAGNALKSAGQTMKKSASAIGGGLAKGASAIGQGVKGAGEKFVDGSQAVGSKVAGLGSDMLPGDRSTANRTALNEIYEDKAKEQLNQPDDKKPEKLVAQKENGTELKIAGKKKGFFGLGKGHKQETEVAASGFYEAVIQKETGAEPSNKQLAACPPKEIAATKEDKKSAFGLGALKAVKMPGLPGFKKKAETQAPQTAQAPAHKTPAISQADLTPTPGDPIESQTQLSSGPKTSQLDPIAAMANSEATPEPESQTPSPVASTVADETPVAIAPVDKTNKTSFLTKGFSKIKLNPFARKKAAPQAENKQTASSESSEQQL